jgi:hypothetical protein
MSLFILFGVDMAELAKNVNFCCCSVYFLLQQSSNSLIHAFHSFAAAFKRQTTPRFAVSITELPNTVAAAIRNRANRRNARFW